MTYGFDEAKNKVEVLPADTIKVIVSSVHSLGSTTPVTVSIPLWDSVPHGDGKLTLAGINVAVCNSGGEALTNWVPLSNNFNMSQVIGAIKCSNITYSDVEDTVSVSLALTSAESVPVFCRFRMVVMHTAQ